MAQSSRQQKRRAEQKKTQPRHQTTKRTARTAKKSKIEWRFPMKRKNFMIAAIGMGLIVLGFILMYTGISEGPAVPDGRWNNVFAVDIAPVLLILGYCVFIPYAILKFFKEEEQE